MSAAAQRVAVRRRSGREWLVPGGAGEVRSGPWRWRSRDTDRPVPCLLPGPDLWLSERRSERREAAKRCGSCPVLAECAALGAAAPLETWGVFGGHDYASDVEDLTELRALAGAVVAGRAGAAAQSETGRACWPGWVVIRAWSTVDLAEAAGLSRYQASEVFRRPWCGDRAACRATRRRSSAEVAAAAEVAGVDGPLVEKLRGLGRPVNGPAGDAGPGGPGPADDRVVGVRSSRFGPGRGWPWWPTSAPVMCVRSSAGTGGPARLRAHSAGPGGDRSGRGAAEAVGR